MVAGKIDYVVICHHQHHTEMTRPSDGVRLAASMYWGALQRAYRQRVPILVDHLGYLIGGRPYQRTAIHSIKRWHNSEVEPDE